MTQSIKFSGMGIVGTLLMIPSSSLSGGDVVEGAGEYSASPSAASCATFVAMLSCGIVCRGHPMQHSIWPFLSLITTLQLGHRNGGMYGGGGVRLGMRVVVPAVFPSVMASCCILWVASSAVCCDSCLISQSRLQKL